MTGQHTLDLIDALFTWRGWQGVSAVLLFATLWATIRIADREGRQQRRRDAAALGALINLLDRAIEVGSNVAFGDRGGWREIELTAANLAAEFEAAGTLWPVEEAIHGAALGRLFLRHLRDLPALPVSDIEDSAAGPEVTDSVIAAKPKAPGSNEGWPEGGPRPRPTSNLHLRSEILRRRESLFTEMFRIEQMAGRLRQIRKDIAPRGTLAMEAPPVELPYKYMAYRHAHIQSERRHAAGFRYG